MASHLTPQERELLYRLDKQGRTKTEIAELMGRDRSTVCRELQRNGGRRGCRPKQAQRWADERRQACRRAHKLDDPEVQQYVRERLQMRWSPDQIAARSRRLSPAAFSLALAPDDLQLNRATGSHVCRVIRR